MSNGHRPLTRFGATVVRTDERIPGVDLPLMSVSQTRGVIRRSELTDKEPRADTLDVYKVCRQGDIVFNKMSVGAGAMGVAAEDGLVTYHYEVMRPRPNTDARFIVYLMKSAWFTGEMLARERGLGSGSTGGGVRTTEVPFSVLRTIDAPIPPHDVQHRIANFLDDQVSLIDEAVRLRREQIEAVAKRFASHLGQAVTRLFADFPESPLRRDLVLIEQGYSPVCDAQSAGSGEFGVLKTSAVRRGVFRADQNKYLPDESLVDDRYVIKNGDILLTRGSGSRDLVADLAVVRGLTPSSPTLLLSDLLYRLRFRSLNADFVAAVLLSPRLRSEVAASTRGAVGGTIKVRGEDLANLVIPVPPKPAQNEFALANAQRTHDRELVVAEMTAQVSLLEERKRSLITAAVTGEFDVTAASGRGI